MHGWLPALANKTDLPFVVVIEEFDRGGGDIINETVIYGGPPTTSKYLTGLVTGSIFSRKRSLKYTQLQWCFVVPRFSDFSKMSSYC